ncbi:Uncharacterised protein [[Clostridium] sordellii]|uniref:hypothetical protein n=1 Tax=Paraclostridium sordellii TaxID=1505 RepID=UPI0005DF4EEE|nr:hypothetical protein [Paeniclostridium sordellii]CEP45942.1 Uncharacterised protein [[Clostridium] sordellii] [Paeniclostridium sordellii]
MKYTIEGFSQRNALAMKLSLEDLLFLRWFIDFKEDGEMKGKYIADINDMGYWVSYKYVIKELPILFSQPPHISNSNYLNFSFEEKKKANKNWINACKKKLQRILSGNLSKVLNRDLHKENVKNEKGQSQINSYVYLSINKATYKFLIKDSYGLYVENKSTGQKCPPVNKATTGQKCPPVTAGHFCPVYPSTNNILYSSTTQSKQKSKDFSSSEKNTNARFIEKNTHLILSKFQASRVEKFDLKRLEKAIEIFKEKGGQYFSLLELIYKDNKNFIPKISVTPKTTQHGINQTYKKYDEDELEKMLLENQNGKFEKSKNKNENTNSEYTEDTDPLKKVYINAVESNWENIGTGTYNMAKKYAIKYNKPYKVL